MDVLDPSAQAGATQTYTGTAGNTSTFQPGPRAVLVMCTTAAYVKVGEGAVATTSDTLLPANTAALFKVPPGSGAVWRVSAIQLSAGGSVYAKPMNGAIA